MEEALIILKPLAIDKENLLLSFFSSLGIEVKRRSQRICSSYEIANHYSQFVGKSFFQPLVEYYTGKTVIIYSVLLPMGRERFRSFMGNATKIESNSLREILVGDSFYSNKLATGVADNGIHCSDSQSEFERELAVWFSTPTTSKRTNIPHNHLWNLLQSIEGVDSFQYAGGEHDGTAVGSVIDLDYRLLTTNPSWAVSQLQNLGLTIDRCFIDDESGSQVTKFEYSLAQFGLKGKADIAVVETQYYRYQVSKSHLISFASDELKSFVRELKLTAKMVGKDHYKAAKKEGRLLLLDSINWK